MKRIYISLAHSSEEEFHRGTEIIQPIRDHGVLLWNEAPAVQSVLEKINRRSARRLGKGRAVWTALGYALGKSEVSTRVSRCRRRDLRSGLPLAAALSRRASALSICQGFLLAIRTAHGRVARLFYFPFVKALRDIIGKSDFLEYMADFRYPLSGEFAIFASIANDLHFPSDWGSKWHPGRDVSHHSAASYLSGRDHKPLRPQTSGSRRRPKRRTAEDGFDIARTFFTYLASGGSILTQDFLRTLKHTYLANARGYVRIYESYAEMNSLRKFDRHQELGLIEVFSERWITLRIPESSFRFADDSGLALH